MNTLLSILPAVMFVVGMGLCILVMAWLGQRDKRIYSPDSRRKLYRSQFFGLLAISAFFTFLWLAYEEGSPQLFGMLALIVAMSGYAAYRPATANEHLKNWVCNTGYCGCCGYDLTGNVSGICPECGTAIPRSTADVEKPWWGAWWVQWQIDHLDDWGKTLFFVVTFAVLFGAMTVWMALKPSLFAAAPGVMCAGMTINTIRVVQYRRRMGH
jgi:hypothetical protein